MLTRATLALACACTRDTGQRPVAWLALDAADASEDALAALDGAAVRPASAVVRSIRTGRTLMLAIDTTQNAEDLSVRVPGSCPVLVSSSNLGLDAVEHRRLEPQVSLRLPAHPRDLGYDAPFVIEAARACPDAVRPFAMPTNVAWRQVSGPRLHDVRADPTGLRFEARTATPEEVGLEVHAGGIVPVSARTSGAIVVEVQWQTAEGIRRQRVELASASRAHGLPNVAVDEGILLAGGGWSIVGSPDGATAQLAPVGQMTRLIPDASGPWTLSHAGRATLVLRSGRYDETVLDCGRSTCHRPLAEALAASPMTHALEKLTGDGERAARDVSCALACHAVGEPGTHDGGFADVMGGFDVGVGWSFLPRAARRLGGVTCLGCHGPGAIPEASARWAILRSDVCATCHDAPPMYGHVAAWASSRMARADADVAARTGESCVPCHTTSGFLRSLGDDSASRVPPVDAGTVGIACAACHAPHDPRHGDAAASDHLLRRPDLPEAFAGVTVADPSRICVRCHAPSSPSAGATPGHVTSPAASRRRDLGRSRGIDPRTGGPLAGASPHGAVDGGCVGCHASGPSSSTAAGAMRFR